MAPSTARCGSPFLRSKVRALCWAPPQPPLSRPLQTCRLPHPHMPGGAPVLSSGPAAATPSAESFAGWGWGRDSQSSSHFRPRSGHRWWPPFFIKKPQGLVSSMASCWEGSPSLTLGSVNSRASEEGWLPPRLPLWCCPACLVAPPAATSAPQGVLGRPLPWHTGATPQASSGIPPQCTH